MAKGDEQDPLEMHSKKHAYSRKLVDTHKFHLLEGYMHAVKTHLTDESGNVDYERLDEPDVQDDFKKTQVDFYIAKIKEKHGKEARSDYDKWGLLQEYMGITPDVIDEMISKYGKRLNQEAFQQLSRRYTAQVEDRLYKISADHITRGHIPNIIEKYDLEDRILGKPTLAQARELLIAIEENNGQVTDDILRQIFGEQFMAKGKKKKQG